MTHDSKRMIRKTKRIIKKDGNRKLRHYLKEDLRKHPEDTLPNDRTFHLGSAASKYLNDTRTNCY